MTGVHGKKGRTEQEAFLHTDMPQAKDKSCTITPELREKGEGERGLGENSHPLFTFFLSFFPPNNQKGAMRVKEREVVTQEFSQPAISFTVFTHTALPYAVLLRLAMGRNAIKKEY